MLSRHLHTAASDCRLCACAQSILKRSGAGAVADKTVAGWARVSIIEREKGEIAPITWKTIDPRTMATVSSLAGNGGGFTNAGAAKGQWSAPRSTITFTLKCLSCKAFGCKKKVKIVVDLANKTEEVLDSKGFPHLHEGPNMLMRGLAPQVSHPLHLTSQAF